MTFQGLLKTMLQFSRTKSLEKFLQPFYTDLGLYQQCLVLQKLVEIEDFSRLLSDFPVLFKADLIFKDFSREASKFKYFSSLCEP